jgi:IS5 family transposase
MIVFNFRRLLEGRQIGAALFAKVGELLQSNGMKLFGGIIVDATLIAAPPSTKNRARARDPKMCQSQKGNQRHFGMKAHIGVKSQTGLIHSANVTPSDS